MIFAPYATRKFGYEFRCLKSGWCGPMTTPWTWHARAWWGCRQIIKANQGVRGTLRAHPLVYKLVDARPESTVTCYCGEMNGQYVPPRDANKVWFEQVPPADPVMGQLTDDQAATVARAQMEAETIRSAGGGRWIGPDESGGRRFKMPGPVEQAVMAMGTRMEIRSEQGNVFVRITCTRCGEQMSEKQFYAVHFTGTPATLTCVRDRGGRAADPDGDTFPTPMTESERERRREIAGDVTRSTAERLANMGGEWEERQACGCTIFRRLGGESVRVTNNCPTHEGMLLSAPAPELTGRARIALDEDV